MLPLTHVLFLLVAVYTVLAFIVNLFCIQQRHSSYKAIDLLNGIFVIVLSFVAWNYNSTTFVDLDRIMQELEIAHQQGIQYLADTYAMNPLSTLLLLIGYYTEDARSLQVTGVALSYSLMFITIGIAKRRYRLSFVSTILGTDLILLCFNFVTAACNIRFPIAMWLILAALVSHRKQHTPLTIAFAGIAILIHIGTAVIPLICLLANCCKKKYYKIFICILLLIYYQSSVLFTNVLLGSSNRIMYQIGDRLSYYTGVNENYANTYDAIAIESGGRSTGVILIALAVVALLVYGALSYFNSIPPAPSGLIWSAIAMLCFTVGSYPSYTIFLRYAYISMYFVILLLMYSLSRSFTLYDIRPSQLPQSQHLGNTRISLLISYWIWVVVGLILAYCMRRDMVLYMSSYVTF